MTDTMQRLQAWYASMCDGDREHEGGVRIETIDNPGWSVRIDVRDTDLEIDEFVAVRVDRSDEDWIVCEIKAWSALLEPGGRSGAAARFAAISSARPRTSVAIPKVRAAIRPCQACSKVKPASLV